MDHLEKILFDLFNIIYVFGVIWIKDGTTEFKDRYNINLAHVDQKLRVFRFK
jgi:hypothetical protein